MTNHVTLGDGRAPANFWAKVVVRESGCWEWSGWRFPAGYAGFAHKGLKTHGHRIAWLLLVGPVPDGLVLDHLCRNRGCVNPAHLEPVTQAENMRRGDAYRRRSEEAAKQTHCKYGHELTPENTYAMPTGRACKECRRRLSREWKARRRGNLQECPSARSHMLGA